MRVLVCGGRGYQDRDRVFEVLDRVAAKHGPLTVIHGACQDRDGNMRGADRWAHEWAVDRGHDVIPRPADWDRYGKAAGMIRNRQMRDEEHPEAVVAFPGKTGTKGMKDLAWEKMIPVWEIDHG